MQNEHDSELMARGAAILMDVFIRVGLIVLLAMLCYRIFSPFLILTTWALILAVAMYPLHQSLARHLAGRQGAASVLLVLAAAVLIVAPTTLLVSSFGDSVRQLVNEIEGNRLNVPEPRESVAQWPVVGERLYALWSQAYEDLPSLVAGMQPKFGELVRTALGVVAGIGSALLMFVAAVIVAGIIMAYGEASRRGAQMIFVRVIGAARAPRFVALSAATIRTVAQGVIGVAFIQAIIVGLCLLAAGVPWAGALAAIVLVLGIAQVPALLVSLPAIAWIWISGAHGKGASIAYTVLLLVAGMADNALKPLLLGRGVDAPMPVILIGALGGMATAGILGIFVGATLLALGYRIFVVWLTSSAQDASPAAAPAEASLESDQSRIFRAQRIE